MSSPPSEPQIVPLDEEEVEPLFKVEPVWSAEEQLNIPASGQQTAETKMPDSTDMQSGPYGSHSSNADAGLGRLLEVSWSLS